MKIGILTWEGDTADPDEAALIEFGANRGHQMSAFGLSGISYLPRQAGGFDLCLAGQPEQSYDAVISRAGLYGDDWQDRVERLTLLSSALGPRLHSSADAWVTGYSKFGCTQRLAAAGLPVPPTRSAASMADLELALRDWGTVIVKPSFEFAGNGVQRITDLSAQADLAADLLGRYGTLACMPFWPTKYGEYRLNVAGEACVTMFKLPPVGTWLCKTYEGAMFERVDPPAELERMAIRAARVLGLTLAGVDALATEDGYAILEVNPVPGYLYLLGEQARQDVFAGVYDWVEAAHRDG